MISFSGGTSPYNLLIGSTLRVPFDACYADSESCDSLKSHSLEVGGGEGGRGRGLRIRYFVIMNSFPQLWGGALRDDTKNGCVVADYTFTNSIQNK